MMSLKSMCSRLPKQAGLLSALPSFSRTMSTSIKQQAPKQENARGQYWQEKMDVIEGRVKTGDDNHAAWKAYEEMGIEYETYVVNEWGYISHQLAVNLLLKHTNLRQMIDNRNGKQINVLDAGCGTGLVGQYLKETTKLKQLNITGMDLSPNMVATTAENNKDVYNRCLVQDLDATPYTHFKSNEFDVVISAGVLPYCKNFEGIIQEWTNLLDKNGIIVTSLRTDMTHIALESFSNMEKIGVLERLELTEPVKHIKDGKAYGDQLLAQFYVARKINK